MPAQSWEERNSTKVKATGKSASHLISFFTQCIKNNLFFVDLLIAKWTYLKINCIISVLLKQYSLTLRPSKTYMSRWACSITSLVHQWMLCSEWVPSEWESKHLIKHDNNPQVTRMTPVHQLMSCEVKSCMFVRNKSITAPIHCRGSNGEQVM